MATAGNTEEAEIRVKLSNGQEVGNTLRSLTTQSNKLKQTIKDLEPGTQEFIDTAKDLAKVKAQWKDIDGEIKDVEKAQNELNEVMNKYMPFSGQLQKFVGGYKDLKKAKDATTISTKLFGKALIGTGIGAILVLFGSLVSYLTSTQEGMNKLRRVTEPLIQIFERLKGLAQELGGSVFKGLAQILKGDVYEGIKTLGAGVKEAIMGVGTAIKEGAKAGTEIAKLNEQISESQIKVTKRTAEISREYKLQSEIAEDISKTEAERAIAAQKAIDLADEKFRLEDDLLALQEKKLLLQQEANDTDYAGQQELAELQAKRIDLETQASESRTTARSKLNAANQKMHADQLAQLKELQAEEQRIRDEKAKAEEELHKKLLKAEETLKDARIALLTDEQDQKIAKLLLTYERDLQAFEGNEDQKAEYAKLKAQQLDADITAIEAENKKKAQAKALEDLTSQNEIEQAKVEELFYSNLIGEEERNQQLYELQVKALEDRLALMVANGETQTLQYAKLYTSLAELHHNYEEEKTQKAKSEAEKRIEIQQRGLQAAGAIFSAFESLLSSNEDAQKKNLKVIQSLQAAQITMASIVEIQEIFKSTAGWGPIGWALGMAKATAAGARAIKAITDVKKVKYAQGGPVFGPSHAGGGIPFGVRNSPLRHEMEGGEIILAKGVYQNPTLRAAASQLNVAGGGRSFAMGGPVNPLANTPVNSNNPGTVINNITNQTAPAQQDSQALVNEVQALRSDLNGWQSQLEVKLSLGKLREAEQRAERLEVETEF